MIDSRFTLEEITTFFFNVHKYISSAVISDCELYKLIFKYKKQEKMIGSLPKLIALLMALLLVASTFVGGIIYFIR
ncbi:hypothetical protein [Prochlorococcus marinus]|uniref:hypothetical protein n=1 Tax=Prochlorococcus marinus TaxID=1219 RepID=UPI001ADC56A1|nr:hypothetical protein [Prochlorococcus marinus]MBO8217537.1 hypothetical protein [Prochlorococcus marinus XMU1405]MBW3048162.1 hypothetical protein [Prochlorococcus marinus str. MU1406]